MKDEKLESTSDYADGHWNSEYQGLDLPDCHEPAGAGDDRRIGLGGSWPLLDAPGSGIADKFMGRNVNRSNEQKIDSRGS